MDYNTVRKRELRINNLKLAKRLARDYDPLRKTIILLPGGGGSLLERSEEKYDNPNPGSFEYEEVWIDLGIFKPARDAHKLEIQDDGRDKGDKIIIPNGPLDFLVKPYDGTKKFFKLRDYNYIGYGFDWRRPLNECAKLLEEFLLEFKSLVMAKGEENPLKRTTLICHSHGGLIATLFLQNIFHGTNPTPSAVSQWIDKVITVATPFYANSGHIRRYYRGEKMLNMLGYKKKRLAQIMSTLPGPYIFLYLDKDTYNQDVGDLEISEYPMVDADDESIDVDPYNPLSWSRFPDWINNHYITEAKKIRRKYTRRLSKSVRDRIYHLRGVEDKRTLNRLRWKNIDGSSFDPRYDKAPIKIKNSDYGPGDGTVPAWGARLAQIPLERTYDLKKAKKHMDLMEHEETLEVIRFTIENNRLPKKMSVKNKKYLGIKSASGPTVDNFLLGIENGTISVNSKKASDPKIWRALISSMV